MKGLHPGHCVVGGVVAVVVLLALGVPMNALLVGLVVAACPLLMFVMMRTMTATDRRDHERTDVPT